MRYPLVPPCLCFLLGMVVCFVQPMAFGIVAIVTVSVLMALALIYYGVYLYRRRSRLALQPVILRQMVVSISILLLFAFAGYCRMLMSWQSSHCAVGAEHQTITAVVIGNPTRFEGKMRLEAVALSGTLRGEHIQTWVYDGHSSSSSFPLPLLRNGMAFTMKAKVRSVDDESSYSHYLISHGIRAVCTTNIHNISAANIDKPMSADNIDKPMSADTFKSLIPFFDRLKIASYNLRQRLLSHLGNIGLRGDHSGIVTAMLLGERSSLSDATISHFRHSGASHVLALSGLHLGIIYMLLQFVTLSRRKRLVTEIVTVVFIWFFVILVGMMPSVVRAASMITICSLFSMWGRRPVSLNSLALVAMIMLMFNPMQILDIGFQLSFISVAFILAYAVPIINMLCPFNSHRLWKWLVSVLVMSIVAQMSTAPIVAKVFAIMPNYFLLTNIVVVPLSWLLLTLSLIMVMLSWVPMLGGWMAVVSMLVASGLDYVLSFISHLPGAVTVFPPITTLTVFCLYIIIICIMETVKSQIKKFDVQCGNML